MFARLIAECAAEGRVPVYLASFKEGRATVGIERVAPDHPAASARGTENLFAFTTERYRDRPLVVRGPGAGPAVTAAGVFGDLLSVAARADRSIGAPRVSGASTAASAPVALPAGVAGSGR
jgi:homoserine dehydrogenase